MKITTIDFETYYGKDYTLSKLTTEEYVRDPRFQTILIGVIVDGEKPVVMREPTFRKWAKTVNWKRTAVLCHHAHFDCAILNWHYDIRPGLILDTLSMARAVIGGYSAYFSLGKLAEEYEIQAKGTAVVMAKDKRLEDFTPEEFKAYGEYCINDCQITRQLFNFLRIGWRGRFKATMGKFPLSELKLIDRIVRMFTEPCLELDPYMLHDYYQSVVNEKEKALISIAHHLDVAVKSGNIFAVDPASVKKVLNSPKKFASVLEHYGVTPPMKPSPTVPGKFTYAFAKTDEDFLALQEHDNPIVQQLVAVRLGARSTLNETRAKRMLGIATRGKCTTYYKYSGAKQTHRLSGGDKTNFQNMPRGGVLRNTICAPPGYRVVVVDSANIEARVVDVLALQEDAIQIYRDSDAGCGPDIYCHMASTYYGRKITKADKAERQLGKTITLACGYGMGPDRFVETARTMSKIIITPEEGRAAVQAYRNLHNKVKMLWYRTGDCLEEMSRGAKIPVDPKGIVFTMKNGFLLPNGLTIKYPWLGKTDMDEWVYTSGRFTSKIHGAKAVENIVQALARIVVMDQCEVVTKMHPDCRWVMSSHDEGAWLAPEDKAEQVLKDAIDVFRVPPEWWPTLPLNAEGGISTRYGWAKE